MAEAEAQGWTVERTSKSHWQFKSPNGADIINAGGDYGEFRALRNLVSRLRRGGFKPPKNMR